MADLLHLAVRALAEFARVLRQASGPFPWPLAISVPFPVVVIAVHVSIWLWRGTAWPVKCEYYPITRTKQRGCRRLVPGEWPKCWQHSRIGYLRRTDKHIYCKLRRWEKYENGHPVEREDFHGGKGILGGWMRTGFLYHRGFARPPRDVVPDLFRELLPKAYRRIHELLHGQLTTQPASGASSSGQVRGGSELLPDAITAAQTSIVSVLLGLLITGVAVILHSPWADIAEYGATFLLFAAWAAFRFGVWRPRKNWRPSALAHLARGFGLLILIALAGEVIGVWAALNRSI